MSSGMVKSIEVNFRLRDAAKAHRGLTLADQKSLVFAAYSNESTDAERLAVFHDTREDEMDFGDTAPRDPVFEPIDNVPVALLHSGRRHFRRGAPRVRLGDTYRGFVAGEHEGRYPAFSASPSRRP